MSKKNGRSFKEIIKEFKNDQIITYDLLPTINIYFPKTNNVNKLQITKEGIYSTSLPSVMNEIINIIEKDINQKLNTLIITDATANVGGSVINFILKAKFVNAIEIDSFTCKVLQHNISLYDKQNVKVYCEDYTKIMNKLTQDIVFIDPPWGGIDYGHVKKLNLELSGISLSDIVNNLKNKTITYSL